MPERHALRVDCDALAVVAAGPELVAGDATDDAVAVLACWLWLRRFLRVAFRWIPAAGTCCSAAIAAAFAPPLPEAPLPLLPPTQNAHCLHLQ